MIPQGDLNNVNNELFPTVKWSYGVSSVYLLYPTLYIYYITLTNSVKQGCVLAPTLFSMVFSAMLVDAFRDHEDEGFPLRYRTDGELFKPSRLKSVRKSHFIVIRDLLFADDCALNAKTQDQMQHQLDLFSQSCDWQSALKRQKFCSSQHQASVHRARYYS